MATLSELRAKGTNVSLKRGSVNKNLGVAPSPAPSYGKTPNPSPLGFAKNVATQTLGMSSDVLQKAAHFVINTPKYVYQDVQNTGIAKVLTGELTRDLHNNKTQQDQLDMQTSNLVADYKSGRVSKDNFAKRMRDLSGSYQELSSNAQQIQSGADRGKVVSGFANTAADILTAGKLQLGKVPTSVVRGVATAAVKQDVRNKVLQVVLDQNATKLEKAITQVPAVRDLVMRNLEYLGKRESQQLAGESTAQYLSRESKTLATNMLIKRPILYQTNIQGAQDVYNHLLEGHPDSSVREAAWLGTQMLSGGPLGAALAGFKWLGKTTRDLAYGKGSFIDEISRQIGNKQGNQMANYLTTLKSSDPQAFKEAERTLRIVQEANLQMAEEDATRAANRVLDHWNEYGIQLDQVTPQQVVELLKNWADAHELKNTLIKAGKFTGVSKEDAGKYVVVRWDVPARKALADALSNAGEDIQSITEAYQRWALTPGNAAGQNLILTNKIESIINKSIQEAAPGRVGDMIAEKINNLSAASVMSKAVPEKYRKQFSELGFTVAQPSNIAEKVTPAVNYEDTRKLVTAVQSGDTNVFDLVTAPQPQLNAIAKTLERFGISPSESNQQANRVLSQQVVSDLATLNATRELGFGLVNGDNTTKAGQVILSKLQQYIENMQPSRIGNAFVAGRAIGPAVHDIRQLTTGEIMDALKISKSEAKAVSKAITQAYAKIPMEFRGLGDKVVDNLYKFNPAQKYYSRIQSALRYTYNPFFRVQESVETNLLSRTQARAPLWMKSMQELDNSARILDEAGVFKTGLPGEAAQDLVLGRITANLTQGQKRNLAGLAETMAKQRNMTLEQLIQRHPEDVTDALRVVVQYPNKGVLNSSLARTLNIAFFPARYNLKVTKLAAEVLAKEPNSVQLAVVNSLFNMRDWLKSDEGIRWQRDNQEAIQLFNWITPVNSIEYTLERLTGKPNSLGDMGNIGGLPLGVITQMLDSQGIINLNTPYVSPKTGDVFPKYIPTTNKARAATALGDVLNSMFSYPGRTLGLPGKNQMIKDVVKHFIDTNGTDFEKQLNTEQLTPLQQNWIRVLKGDTSPEAIDALYTSPADGQFNWYTLPPQTLPVRNLGENSPQLVRRTGLPRKGKGRSRKVKPVALPISR